MGLEMRPLVVVPHKTTLYFKPCQTMRAVKAWGLCSTAAYFQMMPSAIDIVLAAKQATARAVALTQTDRVDTRGCR